MTVDADSAEQTAGGVGSIQMLAIAPNGQFVAAYTADGRLKVWVSDFSKALSEFATQSDKLPEQLEWCGTDSVVMCWQVRHAAQHLLPQDSMVWSCFEVSSVGFDSHF